MIGELLSVLSQVSERFSPGAMSLTSKTVAIFWLAYRMGVEWVFKTDDDSFLGIPKLLESTQKVSAGTVKETCEKCQRSREKLVVRINKNDG